MCMFCIAFNLCKIWSSEKPWGDCSWLGYNYKPSISKLICFRFFMSICFLYWGCWPVSIHVMFSLPPSMAVRPCTQDVVVTFYTSNFDATPPQCAIPWNGTYLPPRSQDPRDPQLPGCWTSDSQEGWHATDYWFWIMDWDHLLWARLAQW